MGLAVVFPNNWPWRLQITWYLWQVEHGTQWFVVEPRWLMGPWLQWQYHKLPKLCLAHNMFHRRWHSRCPGKNSLLGWKPARAKRPKWPATRIGRAKVMSASQEANRFCVAANHPNDLFWQVKPWIFKAPAFVDNQWRSDINCNHVLHNLWLQWLVQVQKYTVHLLAGSILVLFVLRPSMSLSIWTLASWRTAHELVAFIGKHVAQVRNQRCLQKHSAFWSNQHHPIFVGYWWLSIAYQWQTLSCNQPWLTFCSRTELGMVGGMNIWHCWIYQYI